MSHFEGAFGIWVSVEDGLPSYHQTVLVLTAMQQVPIWQGEDDKDDVWPEDPYQFRLAQLKPQFRTEKPFWVSSWDGELIEDINLVITHWMRLPLPPETK